MEKEVAYLINSGFININEKEGEIVYTLSDAIRSNLN
jgi:hypothetical protein